MPRQRDAVPPARTPKEAVEVILYTRVSSDEQVKGYSLRDQEARLREHYERRGLRVVEHVVDDGYSAKTFERPGWRRVEALVDARRGRPVVVGFTKWSRFSRNVTDGYAVIRSLRERGAEPQAIEQPVDLAIPEQWYVLAFYLTEPDVDNQRRSITIRQGMRRAMLEGRWVSAPPVGYRRALGPDGKPGIEPDDVTGPLVRESFEAVATHPSPNVQEIWRRMRRKGLKVGHSRFATMLRAEVYVGRIRVPADGTDPERVVEAVHAPIVERSTFEAVQKRLAPRSEGPRRRQATAAEGLELRGLLVCPACGTRLTGSLSTGRTGTRYGYYHCLPRTGNTDPLRRGAEAAADRPSVHGHARYRAEGANDAMLRTLWGMAPSRAAAALYRAVLADVASEDTAARQQTERRLRERLAEMDARMNRADDMLVDGTLPSDTYARLRVRHAADTEALRAELAAVEATASAGDVVAFALEAFSNLGGLYERSSAEGRAALVVSIWPSGLHFDGTGYGNSPVSDLVRAFTTVRAENAEAAPRVEERLPARCPRLESNQHDLTATTS